MPTYRIVEGLTPSELEVKVNALIQQGWKPQGGLAIGLPAAIRVGFHHLTKAGQADVQSNLLLYTQALIYED